MVGIAQHYVKHVWSVGLGPTHTTWFEVEIRRGNWGEQHISSERLAYLSSTYHVVATIVLVWDQTKREIPHMKASSTFDHLPRELRASLYLQTPDHKPELRQAPMSSFLDILNPLLCLIRVTATVTDP